MVPEAFGNRVLFSADECDDCNGGGSRFETDLASLLIGSRLISMLPAKKKSSVKHRHGSSEAFVEATPSLRRLFVKSYPSDGSVRLWRTPTGCVLSIRVPSFRPVHVAKALGRMAFFTLSPEQRAELDHLRRWLRGEEEWPCAWFCMFPLRSEGTLRAAILQVFVPDSAKRGAFPPLMVKFGFGRSVLVTQIPDASWNVPKTAMLESGDLLLAPPDLVRRDMRHDLEFYSPELAAQLPPTHAEIAEAAYFRHLARGDAPGSAHEDWIAAEQDLLWSQMGIEPDVRPI